MRCSCWSGQATSKQTGHAAPLACKHGRSDALLGISRMGMGTGRHDKHPEIPPHQAPASHLQTTAVKPPQKRRRHLPTRSQCTAQITCCLDPFSLQLRDILVLIHHALEYLEDGQGYMTSMPIHAHQLLLHLPHSQLRHWQQTTETKHQAPVQRIRSFPRNRTCRPEKRCSELSICLVPTSS